MPRDPCAQDRQPGSFHPIEESKTGRRGEAVRIVVLRPRVNTFVHFKELLLLTLAPAKELAARAWLESKEIAVATVTESLMTIEG